MNDARQVPVDPRHAARVVADFLTSLGLDGERWVQDPFTREHVVDFARRLGYDVRPDTLREFVAKGYLADPGESWDATAFYCLVAALEGRRRWLPTPCPQHDPKKSGARLQVEQCRAAGVPAFEDLDRHTLEDLLLWLAGTDQRAIREAIYEATRAKLARLGFIEE